MNCKKCYQPLTSMETSLAQWPLTTWDSRGDNFEYLCLPCGLGYDEEDFQTSAQI